MLVTMYILLGIGLIILVVGRFMIIGAAFGESVLWGLGVLCVDLVFLIFLMTHWEESKRGFKFCMFGFLIGFLGVGVGFATGLKSFSDFSELAQRQVTEEQPATFQPEARRAPEKVEARRPEPKREEHVPDKREPTSMSSELPQDCVGMKLTEIKEILGSPMSVVSENRTGKTTYFYRDVEFESKDGVTVSYHGVRAP